MVDSITILAGHPYFDVEKPVVSQLPDKQWRVRWRDFHGMKQDVEFENRQKAMAFASTLCRPPLLVDNDACDLEHCDKMWRELALLPKK